MVEVKLENQIAIVVGSGRGIGRAIALKLAEAGANVVVADFVKENADGVAEEIRALGVQSKAYLVDVTKEEQMNALVDDVVKEFGTLDIMVNNAGFNSMRLFMDADSKEFSKMIDINLKGAYYGSKAAAKYMVANKRGKIVTTASQAGVAPFEFHSMYAATKYGIIGMSQVMAKELGQFNINVNCICPGIVRTEMWEQNLRELDRYPEIYDPSINKEILWGGVVDMIPMKRPQEVEDMANAVLFLCSDLAENISGQAICVNGAQVCH